MSKIRRIMVVAFCCLVMFMGVFNTCTYTKAKVKLNKSSLSLKVKKTYTLKLKGTKKAVKWSSNKKKVATVSKKGVVTAKKVGSATITAKVGKKKYSCKVTVENSKTTPVTIPATAPPVATEAPLTNEQLAANIEVTSMQVGDTTVLYMAKNNNTTTVNALNVSFSAYTASNVKTDWGKFYLYFIKPGETAYYFKTVSSSTVIDHSKTKATKIVGTSNHGDASDTTVITHSVEGGAVTVNVANNASKELYINVIILYKNAAGECVAVNGQSIQGVSALSSDSVRFDPPYTGYFNSIEYATYEIWTSALHMTK